MNTSRTRRTFLFRSGSLIVLVATVINQGCAVHYHDAKTGAEHLWGFGHMTMKATTPDDGHQAIVRGTDLLGLSTGKTEEGLYFSLGWDHRRRVEVLDSNTAVSLEWPNNDFLKVRVGSSLPSAVPGTVPPQGMGEEER